MSSTDDPTTQVVNWDSELAKYAAAAAAAERPSAGVISLKSGVISCDGQVAPGNKIQAIVLASIVEHDYFPNRYDANKVEMPVCFAFSKDGEDMVPHAKSTSPQSTKCATCPQFAWGSDPNGGRGKACKEKRKLALVPVSTVGNADLSQVELRTLMIPVTSVRNWGNFVAKIATSYRRPPFGVITEISVTPDPKTQFKVHFAEAGMVPVDNLPVLMSRVKLAEQVLMTPYEANPEAPVEKKAESKKDRSRYT